MTLRVICVGKKHEEWVRAGVERYEKRLTPPYSIEWVLLPHSAAEGVRARQEESEAIRRRLPQGAFVILLDERGTQYDSPAFAAALDNWFAAGRDIYLVIGGAYGVDDQLYEEAAVRWSLSKLVFPHQLVRLLLTEQVYRALQISRGGSYHHV